jgi:hypothetical protein
MGISIDAAAAVSVSLLAAAGLSACGGSGQSPPSGQSRSVTAHRPGAAKPVSRRSLASPARPSARRAARVSVSLAGRLPAPVQDPATTALGGRVLLIGGLDQSDVSVSDVIRASVHGARVLGSLPTALHDAAAAVLGTHAYVLGGGEPSHDEITQVAPPSSAPLAGRLPAAASDVGAASIGDTVYIVGGYTGVTPLRSIVAWSGSGVGRVVATLPHPVRYAAVAADAGRLIIAGGTNGVLATRDVYSFDPGAGRVTRLAWLPRPLTHASAVTLGGVVFVIGGRGSLEGTQLGGILAIDPLRRSVHAAGSLPVPLSDTGAASVPGGALVVGGRGRGGTLSDRTYLLREAP